MKRLLGMVGSALLTILAGADGDTVLFHDTFDSENGGVEGLNYTSFANWNVTRNGVDIIGNGQDDIYPGNGMYVDMNGSIPGLSQGKIETKTLFMLNPGMYQLNFNIGNNNQTMPNTTNTVTVSLGSVFSENFSRVGTPPLQTITRTINVLSATTGRIIFDSGPPADIEGIIVDDVKLALIPEPSTALLVGISLLSAAIVFGKRKMRIASRQS